MKLVIQNIESDGTTKFIEKVATCRPEGPLSLTEDVFDEVASEQQWEVDGMADGKEKLEACLRFADACIGCSVYDKALAYYSYVLEHTVSGGRITEGCEPLAERAYQGLVCCNACEDEYTWEVSSEYLAGYGDLFAKKDEKHP